MPHPPAPAARRGTEFHAWVETRYGQQSLLDLDDLPGSADADIATDDDLRELKAAFEGGPFAHRAPVAVEAPFALLVGGRVVNGRIDAVFAGEEAGIAYDVIDWKTGSARNVDPMQLAHLPAGVGAAHGRAGRAGVRGVRHRRHRRGAAPGHDRRPRPPARPVARSPSA